MKARTSSATGSPRPTPSSAASACAKDTRITIGIGAANRDPEAFPDPHVFSIKRTPNRHLAFGSGVHQCVGLSLARLEGRVAVELFLQRFPKYALAGEPEQSHRVRFRGFNAIPARLILMTRDNVLT